MFKDHLEWLEVYQAMKKIYFKRSNWKFIAHQLFMLHPEFEERLFKIPHLWM